MNSTMLEMFKEYPVVADVIDQASLKRALTSVCPVVFLLIGDICNIGQIVQQVKDAGKIAIIHMDLVEGLACKEAAVHFIRTTTKADGIISTKPILIKAAKVEGLITVQRFFLLDALSYENVSRLIRTPLADFVEVMPGAMPKIIQRIVKVSANPVIAGGLLFDEEDAKAALAAGAVAVSTSYFDYPVKWEL